MHKLISSNFNLPWFSSLTLQFTEGNKWLKINFNAEVIQVFVQTYTDKHHCRENGDKNWTIGERRKAKTKFIQNNVKQGTTKNILTGQKLSAFLPK